MARGWGIGQGWNMGEGEGSKMVDSQAPIGLISDGLLQQQEALGRTIGAC